MSPACVEVETMREMNTKRSEQAPGPSELILRNHRSNDRSEKFAVQEASLLGGEFVEQFVEFAIAHKKQPRKFEERFSESLSKDSGSPSGGM